MIHHVEPFKMLFTLVYGLKLPSEIYSKYAFAEKLKRSRYAITKSLYDIKE